MARRKQAPPPSAQETQAELSRCIVQLLLVEPFLGHLLGGVLRETSERTPTAAVSLEAGRIHLVVNPTFFLRTLKRQDERVAVIKHEALHLLFRHLFRLDLAQMDVRIFNLAADLVVNQFIGKPWKLPKRAITLKTFRDLKLQPDQSLQWYYNRLMERFQKEGESWLGSFPSLSTPATQGDHSFWCHAAGQTPLDVQIAEAQLEQLVFAARQRTDPRSWGAMPNLLRSLIDAFLEHRKATIDWRRVLRLFAASSRKTRVTNTHRRPSRRYGTLPGTQIKRHHRLAVVVDTSGSIADNDLSDFFSEIYGIWRHGAQVFILEVDAQLQRSYPYRGKLPTAVAGRGGTSFDPAFSYLREHPWPRWDACFYLTDGHAPAPSVKPPCPVLWVLTSDGADGKHLRFGRVIRIKRPA